MARVVLRLISMVIESSTMSMVIAMDVSLLCGFQCWFERCLQPCAQFDILWPTDDHRPGRHQNLEVGGMQMGAGRQVHFRGGLFLQGFEQRLGFFHSNHFPKYHAVFLVFYWHQTISRIFRIISTEPSPIRAEPDQTDKRDKKPARGF